MCPHLLRGFTIHPKEGSYQIVNYNLQTALCFSVLSPWALPLLQTCIAYDSLGQAQYEVPRCQYLGTNLSQYLSTDRARLVGKRSYARPKLQLPHQNQEQNCTTNRAILTHIDMQACCPIQNSKSTILEMGKSGIQTCKSKAYRQRYWRMDVGLLGKYTTSSPSQTLKPTNNRKIEIKKGDR